MTQTSQTLLVGEDSEGRTTLICPGIGQWQGGPSSGEFISAGQMLGSLILLGRPVPLLVPANVRGFVIDVSEARSCEYGEVLVRLTNALDSDIGKEPPAVGSTSQATGMLRFVSNSSGRYYSRPSPDKPEFVREGDEIEVGQTVYLLEVMKTFSRVPYSGEGLPTRAKVVRVVPQDGDDLEPGQTVLELEAL